MTWKPVIGPGPWCGTVGGSTNHRCTCDRCKAALAEYRSRAYSRGGSARVHARATTRAATWVRSNRPDVWEALKAEAQAHVVASSSSAGSIPPPAGTLATNPQVASPQPGQVPPLFPAGAESPGGET